MSLYLKVAEQIKEQLIAWRRHIHENAELSMKEYKTAEFVENELRSIGIEDVRRVGETGVLAKINGCSGGKVVFLRADMDALPGKELADVPFKSTSGAVHSCGHDVHTACLLGAAKLLHDRRDTLNGTVKLAFQPGEELAAGARMMIAEGVLENPDVDAAVMLHCFPSLPAGWLGMVYGVSSASSDRISINIKGKQGHGAHPHQCVDAVFIAGHVITALQGLISREISPMQNAVLSLCKIEGGLASNIISGSVHIEGSLRTLDGELQKYLHGRINDVVTGIAVSFRGSASVEIETVTPVLKNDAELTKYFAEIAESIIGTEKLHVFPAPSMGSEDFAFFSDKVPGTGFRLGTGFHDRDNPPLHSESFYVNEDCLPLGAAALCALTARIQGNP